MSRSTTPHLPVFYVYALMDERKPGPFYYGNWKFDFEPFYIGKGKDTRWKSHLKHKSPNYTNPHNTRKIRKMEREGYSLKVRVVRENMCEADAFSLEIKLISRIGRYNLRLGPLTNLTRGGEGMAGQVISKKTRKILKAAGTKQFASMTPEQLAARTQKAKDAVAANPIKEAARVAKIAATASKRSEKEKAKIERKKRKTRILNGNQTLRKPLTKKELSEKKLVGEQRRRQGLIDFHKNMTVTDLNEFKAKLSAGQQRRLLNETEADKAYIALRKKEGISNMSEEARLARSEKISNSMKAVWASRSKDEKKKIKQAEFKTRLAKAR